MMEVNAIVVVFAAGEAAWMLTFPGPYKTSSLHWRRKAFLRLHLMLFFYWFQICCGFTSFSLYKNELGKIRMSWGK